eukprot:Blabericola_migrator_1__3949@NODE_219_length_11213_cov_124_951821_g186_i0_p5_GENE_NODE_219_length_11213_cov_124_951821_g186_i0NODE_219_length_11213_cov_124_951821_g186_i0_p5_ORF_typecomplete_len406_score50_66Ofd1_CTDD/PF10637_9/0_089_NODE_219_length_11213_cov_124_951821_g186_i066777894
MMEPASQAFVWTVPENLMEAPPDQDVYSSLFRLSNGTRWRLCLRPCTAAVGDSDDPESPSRLVRTTNNANNWMGIWLQNMDETEAQTRPSHNMRYTLSLVTKARRVVATLTDTWSVEYWKWTRGTYWLASYETILNATGGRRRKPLGLHIIMSCSLGSSAGALMPFWPAYSMGDKRVVRLKTGDAVFAIPWVLLCGTNLELKQSQPMSVDHIMSEDCLTGLVPLLYEPCEATLDGYKSSLLMRMFTACWRLGLKTHARIVLNALQSQASLEELLVIHHHLKGDAVWTTLFWKRLYALISEGIWRTPSRAKRLQLARFALSQFPDAVNDFLYRRPEIVERGGGSEEACLGYAFQRRSRVKAMIKCILLDIIKVSDEVPCLVARGAGVPANIESVEQRGRQLGVAAA